MPTVNNVEHLRKWLRGCPALLPENHFRVDYVAEEPIEYSLVSVPSSLQYHRNVLGEDVLNDIQTLTFIFATREMWGAEESQNLGNLGFYQDVIGWMLEQNSLRHFPKINGGIVQSIRPILTPYVTSPGTDSARYQITIEIRYHIRN